MEKETLIKVIKSGPLSITGDLKIVLPTGEETAMDKAYLCRCGKSNNKPFCDGEHSKIGFDK